jgi:Oxysterol-binding protein
MKARSPADAKKWVWALKESRIWMADTNKPHSRQSSSHHAQEESIGASRDSFSNILTPMGVNATDKNDLSSSADAIEGADADLFSFLEQQAKNEMHSTEMRRFLILLKTEMQVQKETVQSAVKLVNEAASTNKDLNVAGSMKDLPALLTDSAQHIEALILGIVRYTNKREILWDQKLKRAHDAQIRMETIVQQLAQDPNITPTAAVAVESMKLAAAPLPPRKKTLYSMNDEDEEEEDDDEFYDAQEAHSPGTLPVIEDDPQEVLFKELPPAELSHTRDPSKVAKNDQTNRIFLDINEFQESCRGYESLIPRRDRLPLDPSLPKPSIAVWSFLKNAIGKDLSKVTLPVLFNEPISMLQRMCEDIEFIELLSLASRVGSKGFAPSKRLPDQPAEVAAKKLGLDYAKLEGLGVNDASLIRLMLVGAFAMSNYSSTAGRTSKPFNPMLVKFEFLL